MTAAEGATEPSTRPGKETTQTKAGMSDLLDDWQALMKAAIDEHQSPKDQPSPVEKVCAAAIFFDRNAPQLTVFTQAVEDVWMLWGKYPTQMHNVLVSWVLSCPVVLRLHLGHSIECVHRLLSREATACLEALEVLRSIHVTLFDSNAEAQKRVKTPRHCECEWRTIVCFVVCMTRWRPGQRAPLRVASAIASEGYSNVCKFSFEIAKDMVQDAWRLPLDMKETFEMLLHAYEAEDGLDPEWARGARALLDQMVRLREASSACENAQAAWRPDVPRLERAEWSLLFLPPARKRLRTMR